MDYISQAGLVNQTSSSKELESFEALFGFNSDKGHGLETAILDHR